MTSGAVPAFSAQDARAFAERFPNQFRDPTQPPPTVTNVEFMTNAEAHRRMGTNISLPDSALLAVITSKGQFVVSAPGPGHTVRGTTGYQIYDARTGNLLVESVAR